jgi:copper chaperone CopZ
MNDITLTIPDMTCGSCVAHVRHAIAGVPGARMVEANLARHEVRVAVDDGKIAADVQQRLILDGYSSTRVNAEA